MPSFTRFAFKNNRLFILLLIFIVIFGMRQYFGFPSQEDPSFTIREAVVTAYFPGMPAERIENLITRRMEEKIREIPEVEFIKAESKTDFSIIHVNVYDRYFNMQEIWNDLRNKMDEVKAELPDGTYGPFVNDDFGDVAIASLALTADGFNMREMYDAAVDIRTILYTVPGVKRVTFYGVQDEVIYLEYSNAKIAEFGVTPQQLISTLRATNTILPGGKIQVQGREIVLEPSGVFNTEHDINNVQIILPETKQSVYLRDIVTVRRDFVDPPHKLAFYQGQPAIMLGVSMADGQNILDVGKHLNETLKSIEADLPIGFELNWATFQSDFVETSISDFTGNLYQTLAIVLIVVVVFLGTRTGLIVGLGVPITMLMTLIIMRAMHIPLHSVSIAALIISLGLLVDNGIVVAEDIKRRVQLGADKIEAAIAAGNSLMLPLLTSTLTTILAFMPLMLAEHRAGEYTYSISQVVSITLLSSWFLAVTITPMMCAYFMKIEGPAIDEAQQYDTRFYRFYRKFLHWVLNNRVPFLLGMVLLMVFSVILLKAVPRQFFPPSERPQYTIYLDMAHGASITQTQEAVAKITDWLQDKSQNPEVTSVVSYIGEGGPRFYLSLSPFDPDPNRAFLLVDIKNSKDTAKMVERTKDYILSNIPEADPDVKSLFLGPSETGVIKLRLVGPDTEKLYQLAQAVKMDLHKIPNTTSISDDWGNKAMNIYIDIDESRAARSAITAADVALSMNAFYSGYDITDYRDKDKIIPITLRAELGEREVSDRLRTVNVYSQATGESVPLLQIADFVPVWKLANIKRRNFEHTITVSARNPDMYASELAKELKPYLEKIDFPSGYRYEWGGEIEDSVKAQKALFAHLPLCLALGFVLLVWQFNSFKRPLIVVMTLPLLIIGGTLGLFLMHATLGFVALLGFLSLGGILINNGIVLIDRIDIEVEEGAQLNDAVINASLKRFRPIIMTTLTTIMGLVPLIFFGGEMWYGMANVIAYGLAVGTVLTLGVVPVLYTLMFEGKKGITSE